MESTLRDERDAAQLKALLADGADAPGLQLIETMFWDGNDVLRLALHMARLQAGAAALGWAVPEAKIAAALRGFPASPARVRLALDRGAAVAVTVAPLPAAPDAWRVGLASARLNSADPWLRIKSTRRGFYDQARANLALDLDELLFLNERGEVCEGTITNVFFDRGQGLRTPPLRCGLLPGVLRAQMALPEEVLLAKDLPNVRLWVGNALRGLIAADWRGLAGIETR